MQKEAHDQRTRTRDISEGDKVFVSNFSSSPKWLPGRSLQTSDTMVEVALDDGRRVRRHADHVRARYEETQATALSSPESSPEPVRRHPSGKYCISKGADTGGSFTRCSLPFAQQAFTSLSGRLFGCSISLCSMF